MAYLVITNCRTRAKAGATLRNETADENGQRPGVHGTVDQPGQDKPDSVPMTNILIDVPIHGPGLAALEALPDVSVQLCDPIAESRLARPESLVRDQDVLFCAHPPANLDDMKALRWVQIAYSGFEHLLTLDLPGRGVRVSNARGVFDIPIAEWCIAMMINLTRDVPGMYRNQQAGRWDRGARFQAEMRGKTVGFWGYGGLCRETARIAKTMGLNVHALVRNGVRPQEGLYIVEGTGDPKGTLPDRAFGMDEVFDFLSGLDFLILGLPLNRQTRGCVTAEHLRALPEHAWLLNPARGPLIEEAALQDALREGWIAGAALDTHHHYPMPPDHPFWHRPNVIMTPHIAGSSESTWFPHRIWDLFVQNVQRFQAGQPLLNALDPALLTPECDPG